MVFCKTHASPGDRIPGLATNSQAMELSLPGEKLRQIKEEARKLLSQKLVSVRALFLVN